MADTPATVDVAEQLVPVRRALLSVSDKAGLAPFAAALHHEFGVELISTGGTAKFLRDAGLPVTDVSAVTGFPEMMDGRVKTLHPNVHGGLLGLRDHADHLAAMKAHGIRPIDLVCINLYPFQQTIERPDVTFDEAIENIDIGGPAMIRSAAKNHAWVVVVTSPDRHDKVLGDLRKHGGRSCAKLRLKQSQAAFAHTADYDGRIAKYLATHATAAVTEERQEQPTGGPARFLDEPHHGRVTTAAPAATPPRLPLEPAAGGRGRLIQRLLDGAGDLPTFVNDLVATQAVTVVGTEAAAFLVERAGSDPQGNPQVALRPIAHIRPDESDAETRAAAIKAFQDLIGRCVVEGKDGAIEVGQANEAGEAQFCLITLLREGPDIAAVSAVITRCRNAELARQRLSTMQLVAGYFEVYTLRKAARSSPLTSGHPEASFRSAGAKGPPAPVEQGDPLPEQLRLSLAKAQNLRYGENPHQRAALYVGAKPREASVAFATQHHGKELSYINLLDADGALACVKEFAGPAACIVKHTTPCGCATADDLATAFRRAYAGDPLAAFGGIVAVNKPVDLAAAEAITSIDKLLEVIVAPYYAEEALDLLRSRWKNARLLEVGPIVQGSDAANPARRDATEVSLHKITGGYLVQERDLLGLDESTWRVASKRQPTAAEMADLRFAWLVCKHVKSNAIVVCKDGMLLGAGAGQMDRPSAARLAVSKAGDRIAGAVAASDAFFPFPDGPALLLAAGVTAVIHPGGSLKDQDTVDLLDRQGAALVLTGQRHFKH